jgi:acyl carrier protein phosphodiesterase
MTLLLVPCSLLLITYLCENTSFHLNTFDAKMNFLAHAFLSGTDSEILVGNFIGDFVKGKQFENFSSGIATGIILHREIDYFTDNHPCVEACKTRLRPRFGHYSPVVVDIFFDHLLVRNWRTYSNVDIEVFIQNIYFTVDKYFDILPPRLQTIFPNIKANNWLLHYGYIEGVKRSLAGMSRRSRFNPELQRAVDELQEHYEQFNEEFNLFFPDAIAFAKQFLEK